MSFLCDGIIKYRGHYYILEIKTEASFKFNERKGVDPSHYHQATAYSIAFGINDVLFLYECRDNCSKKAFMLHVTDDMKQELLSYIEECDSYIKKLKVPPIPENVPKKACSYCNYKGRCNTDA
jgi:CRISPR/Cas system-associated exonuclease Cas4 (RecB family)